MIDNIFDPHEDPEDTIDRNDLPGRQHKIRTVLAQIISNYNRKHKVKLLTHLVESDKPGLTYIVDGPGNGDSRKVWLDAKICHNPVFKYALFRHRYSEWSHQMSKWSPHIKDNTGWHDLYPGVHRVGGVGLYNENEAADPDDYSYNSTLQLMQFADYESLARFKLTTEYVPMHAIVPLPHADPKLIFKDSDRAHYRGWKMLFRNTDFDETEIRGVMLNYKNFDRMEVAFLGDLKALNQCYAAIGGKTYFAWLSHRLAKTYKGEW